ncbi:MAG: Stp1/IreP family PP2C-type Ser/Thr phosphatase [Dehalococcoidia bacterium]
MIYKAAMLTDTGLVRSHNEDSVFIFDSSQQTEPVPISYGLYIVADGMGGHQAGEVASQKAIQIIKSRLLENVDYILNTDINAQIREAFEKANSEIYHASQTSPLLSGMGTTATLGLRSSDRLYIGHVGDSRAYLIRSGEIIRITRDHSLVESLITSGVITKEEARVHPDRNVITRALGTSINIMVDSYKDYTGKDSILLNSNDRIVFCTDGLTNEANEDEILEIIQQVPDVSIACQNLVEVANNRGGNDNITVIVVQSL